MKKGYNTINEELKRMLNLVNYKSGNIINEQETPAVASNIPANNKDKAQPKKPTTNFTSADISKPTIPQDQWDQYLQQNESDFVNLITTKTGKNYWLDIKKNYKSLAVVTLENFIETKSQNKYDKVLVSKTTENIPIPDEKIEPVYPKIPMFFPGNLDPNTKFFKDNYYTFDNNTFINAVKTDIIDPILESIKLYGAENEKPPAVLTKLIIRTSCSTVPNTKNDIDNKIYTFEELSKKRNDTAKEYVISKLTDIGVEIEENAIIQDWNGTNTGDLIGSSGPPWDINWTDEVKKQKKQEYEKNKKLEMEFDYSVNKPVTPKIGGKKISTKTFKNNVYKISLHKKLKFKLPPLKFPPFLNKFKNKPRSKPRLEKCFSFGKTFKSSVGM